MSTAIRMPDLGTVEVQVVLVRWLKAEGDSVAVGEPLFEVETDKGVSEVESALGGILVRRVLAEGATAGPGEIIAYIRRPDEPEEEVPAAHGAPHGAEVGPVLNALAGKHGVEISAVKPTGPGGRITRQDILAAAREKTANRAAPASAGRPVLSRNQALVATKVTASYREKPVYRVTAQADMSRATGRREETGTAREAASWDAVFVKSAAKAVEEMPIFRRWFKGIQLQEHVEVDIAVAVSAGEDLFLPAVRAPARLPLHEVSARIQALAATARAGALRETDVQDSCLLVSNLGMFPIQSFDAIIYPEHSAALAVGAIHATPVTDGRKIWIAPTVQLTLSVDHRVINGLQAARFLSRVKEILEKGEFA